MSANESSQTPASLTSASLRMALEQAVARLVALDPVVGQRLEALNGQVLQVESTLPAFCFYIRFGKQPLLFTTYEGEPDCTLTGTAIELLRVALHEQPLLLLPSTDVVLTGSNELLQTAAAIVREADFDWEGALAEYTGGIMAHLIGSMVRSGQRAISRASEQAVVNLPEFVQEELRLLPPKGEVEAFQDDLNQLQLATDRLRARVERLAEKAEE